MKTAIPWSRRYGAAPAAKRDKRIPSYRAFRRQLAEDFAVNRSKIMAPGFHAVAVYRFGVWVDGLDNRFARWPLRRLYLGLHAFVRNFYGIEISYLVRIGRRLRIAHQSGIVVHEFATLGDDCLLRQNVTIGVTREDTPREEAPVIGDRVQLGAGAVVLSPARIGDDVVIGPNIVVRSDVPSGSAILPQEATIRPRRAGAPAG